MFFKKLKRELQWNKIEINDLKRELKTLKTTLSKKNTQKTLKDKMNALAQSKTKEDNPDYMRIKGLIEEQASKGLHELHTQDRIPHTVLEMLEDDGFTVKVTIASMTYHISWY